jgi:ubiquinol-cytochrome c reductase cytochrome c subunit
MRTFSYAVFLSLVVACGGGNAESGGATTPASSSGSGPAPQTFAAQVEHGQKLYGEKCASCHGAGGEGSANAPRVVGVDKGALPLDPPAGAKYRKTQFKTAADVAGFVVKAMPPGGDPSLKEEDYWAILAFDLKANGVELPHKLDASNAKEVVLHK